MTEPRSKADDLMRRASEAFARGKLQKAHKMYGQAIDAYAGRAAGGAGSRIALAHYTRALLVLKGDAVGDVGEDLDRGDALVIGQDFPEATRFRGLYRQLRAVWRRQYDELDEAQRLLDGARIDLATSGRPHDLFELEHEQARLAADRREWPAAHAAAGRALAHADTPKHKILARSLDADLYEMQNELEHAREALEAAASVAFEAKLKNELWDIEDRIKLLAER